MLPTITHPTFPVLVPSLDRAGRFRPFTVKEEKLLLMAKESEDVSDHFRAIYNVTQNCCMDDAVDFGTLATFDVEWLFLKLRAESVGRNLVQSFTDNFEAATMANPPTYNIEIDLDKVAAPVMPEGWKGSKTFMMDGEATQGVRLRFPPASLYLNGELEDAPDATLYRSTVEIFSGADKFTEFTKEECVAYYDGWTMKAMEPIKEFLATTPHMSFEATYTDSKGEVKKARLTGLADFFTF